MRARLGPGWTASIATLAVAGLCLSAGCKEAPEQPPPPATGPAAVVSLAPGLKTATLHVRGMT